MNKEAYMNQLRERLKDVDAELVAEIAADYEEHFDLGKEDGKTEEQICRELGSIEDMIKELPDIEEKREPQNKLAAEAERTGDWNTDTAPGIREAETGQEETDRACKRISAAAGSARALHVKGLIAHITVVPSVDGNVNVTYRNTGSLRMQMAYQLIYGQSGDTLHVEVRRTGIYGLLFNPGLADISLYIEIPVDYPEVAVSNISNWITVDGIRIVNGNFSSTSGTVTLKNAMFHTADVGSISGKAEVNGIFTDSVCAHTTSGSIRTECSGPRVECNSVSGKITARDLFHEGCYSTISGRIDIQCGKKGQVEASSVSGGITVRCQKDGAGIRAELNTISGGLKFDCHGQLMEGRRRLVTAAGTPEMEVNCHTTSGRIRVEEHEEMMEQ